MAKTFVKMTRPIMRALPVGKCIREHGICYERQRDGDGTFSINTMVDGQRIHRVVGRESDGTTRTQAEEFISKVRNDAKHSRLSLPRGRKVALTFRQASEKYLVGLEQEGGKDLVAKRRRLEMHLVPFFGNMPLSKISSFDVERYKKQRAQEENLLRPRGKSVPRTGTSVGFAKPATINRELAVLSHLFNKAIEWGWVDHRPAKINRLKEGSGRVVYLTQDQLRCLLECAKADQSEHVYPFVVIAASTGMRPMEVLCIRREDVDLDRKMVHIRKAKAGAREQPIPEHLCSFLESHMQALPSATPWLFPSPGAKEGHAVCIRKAFRRVVAAAGLDPDKVVRHTLRHTAITHLVQAGVDLPTVQRISGHKTLAMVQRYAHANGTHIQEALGKLGERLKIA